MMDDATAGTLSGRRNKRLTKAPPVTRSSTSVTRSPSVPNHPSYTRSASSYHHHQRTPTSPNLFASSSSSSLDQVLQAAHDARHSQNKAAADPLGLLQTPIPSGRLSEETLFNPRGSPSTGSSQFQESTSKPNSPRNTLQKQYYPGMTSAHDIGTMASTTSIATTNTKVPSRSPSPVRPKMRSVGTGTLSPNRLSDETKGTIATNNNKKKTGFSGLFNNMLGAPKKFEISSPSNPVHLTHVGFDSETGEFTVCITS